MEPLGPPAGGLGGVAKILKNYHNNRAVETNHKRYRIVVNYQNNPPITKNDRARQLTRGPARPFRGSFWGSFWGSFLGSFLTCFLTIFSTKNLS